VAAINDLLAGNVGLDIFLRDDEGLKESKVRAVV